MFASLAALSMSAPPQISWTGLRCCVTGGAGFVGRRLVEMCLERGAAHVVSFDIAPPAADAAADSPQLRHAVGDITKLDDVRAALQGVDCVFHVAALVGPFYDTEAYEAVNYRGTLNVLEACKELGVRKVVMSSSPSTRFDPWNLDISGLKEEQLQFPDERIPPRGFTAEYARTKAFGERALRAANDGEKLMTVAIAPHQVYGPRDSLFLPSLLETAGYGQLRIFGKGGNRISFTHVDNYCHALLLGERYLYPGSPVLGKFYIATDDDSYDFWAVLDEAVKAMGYTPLASKWHLPVWLLMMVAYISVALTKITGVKYKLNPFTVKMLIINRYFDISNIKQDMGYKPIIPFEQGWADTIEWFKENWLTGKTNFKAQPAPKAGE
uniref:3-beta hydroxysteroid dehydrogenase/isomerase domain-containing protein n=1 Tax=Pinguiococcus pyrenoidosus TaxID=172671 RepID=A0A7R9U132_9STRA